MDTRIIPRRYSPWKVAVLHDGITENEYGDRTAVSTQSVIGVLSPFVSDPISSIPSDSEHELILTL